MATSMTYGQHPGDHSLCITLLRRQAEQMGERISDQRFKGIMVSGLTTDYREVQMMTYRESKMGLDHAIHVLG